MIADIPTQYCEFFFGQFISQPINVVSNIGFIIASITGFFLVKDRVSKYLYLLPFLLLIVGISSFWWHLTSSQIGDTLDTISIAVFGLVSAFVLFLSIVKSKFVSTIYLIALLTACFLVEKSPLLNGSLPYVLLWGVFLIAGIVYIKKYPSSKKPYIFALLVFLFSIIFRTLDMQLCPVFPYGTHFIWHILNAIFSYLLIVILARPYITDAKT